MTDKMRKVIIESPYAGAIDSNVAYARKCMLDALKRGEAPMVSHLLYTQVLADLIPGERELGIAAGLAWRDVAHPIFYVDLGWSKGMNEALLKYVHEGRSFTVRTLDADSEPNMTRVEHRWAGWAP